MASGAYESWQEENGEGTDIIWFGSDDSNGQESEQLQLGLNNG